MAIQTFILITIHPPLTVPSLFSAGHSTVLQIVHDKFKKKKSKTVYALKLTTEFSMSHFP